MEDVEIIKGIEGLDIDYRKIPISELVELAEALEEHKEPFVLYLENANYFSDTWSMVESFKESYQGYYESDQSFAQEFAIVTDMDTKEYFDLDAFQTDLFMDYWSETAEGGGVHIFRSL